MKIMEDKPISWDRDGQVLFCGGCGWGLDKQLRNICLGTEEEVKKILSDERSGISQTRCIGQGGG